MDVKGGKKIEIYKYTDDRLCETLTGFEAPTEIHFDLLINGIKVITLSSSSTGIYELGAGFLFSEGFIDSANDISNIEYKEERRELYITIRKTETLNRLLDIKHIGLSSGCGKGITFTDPYNIGHIKCLNTGAMLNTDDLRKRFKDIMSLQMEDNLSIGLHIASIFDNNRIHCFTYDVARHNAVDKAIGYALLHDIKMSGLFLFTTGRVSSEMVLKCARAGLPIIVSHSSPTTLSIDIADKLCITLIGYIRKNSLIIYTHRERIKSS